MTRMDARLEAKEKRLKAQFAAMETAMSQSQTQHVLARRASSPACPSWSWLDPLNRRALRPIT